MCWRSFVDLLVREAEEKLLESDELLMTDLVAAEVVEEPEVARLPEQLEDLRRAEHRAEDGEELAARAPHRLEERREIVDSDDEPLVPDAREEAGRAGLHVIGRGGVGHDEQEEFLGELRVDGLPEVEGEGSGELGGRMERLEGVAEPLQEVDLRDEVALPEDRLGRDVQVEVVVGDAAEELHKALAREVAPPAHAPRSGHRRRVPNEARRPLEPPEGAAQEGLLVGMPLADELEGRLDVLRFRGVQEEPLGGCLHGGQG